MLRTLARCFAILLSGVLISLPVTADTLRVGISPDYPPLAFSEGGEVVGVEADNMRAVSSLLNRKMTFVEMPFVELIPALEEGKVDIVMSGMSATAERSARVLFTDAYMVVGQMAIMHRDKIARFGQPWSIYREGVRVGVEPGTTGENFARRELTDAILQRYPDPSAAFEALRRDEIDLYIHDAPTSWQLAQSTQNSDLLSLYAPLTNEQLAWAVRKDDEALAAALNQALRALQANGTMDYILNRWIPVTIKVQ